MANDIIFELPPNMVEEDTLIVQNILTGLQSLGVDSATGNPLCVRYKVEPAERGYLIKAAMPMSDLFEVSDDDIFFIKSICPARIDSVAMGRSQNAGACELLVRVLDAKQRVMITSTVSYFSCIRKRKMRRITERPFSSSPLSLSTATAAAPSSS